MYLHHPQIVRARRARPRRRARPARARPRVVLVLPDLPERPAGRPGDGRRLAVGRRLLPGQLRPPGRRRGARPDRRVRPLRRARRRPDVRRPAPLPGRPARPVRQRVRGARPRSGSRSSAATRPSSSTAPFLTEPDGPPPSLVRWRGREATPIAGPGRRPGPPRGRGPDRRDPRRHAAPDRPCVEPRYDRDARRAGPDGPRERRAPEPGAGRLALARAAGAPAEEEETCRTAALGPLPS